MGDDANVTDEKPRGLADILRRVIIERRSIRKYADKDIPDDDIRKMIEAATWAANAGNKQGWYFIAIKNKELLEKMRQKVFDAVEDILQWPEAADYQARMASFRTTGTFFADAPIAVAVLTQLYDSPLDRIVLPRHGYSFEQVYRLRTEPGLQSIGAAVQNMLLMAHALGYGTCWMTGPLIACPALEGLLDVKEPWRLAAVIPVGVPLASKGLRPRKPLEEVYSIIR